MKTSWNTSTENHGAQLITALGYLQTLKHTIKLEFAPLRCPVCQCCTCLPHTSPWDHPAGTPTPESQRKRLQGVTGAQFMARKDRPEAGMERSGKSTLPNGPGVWGSSGVVPLFMSRGNILWRWKHGTTYSPQKNTCCL